MLFLWYSVINYRKNFWLNIDLDVIHDDILYQITRQTVKWILVQTYYHDKTFVITF